MSDIEIVRVEKGLDGRATFIGDVLYAVKDSRVTPRYSNGPFADLTVRARISPRIGRSESFVSLSVKSD